MKAKRFLIFLGLGLALLVGACQPTPEVDREEGTEEVKEETKEEMKEKEEKKDE